MSEEPLFRCAVCGASREEDPGMPGQAMKCRQCGGRAGPRPRPLKPPGARPRLLVVEDRADARESLCALLALLGYDVQAAEDGVQGIRLAMEWRPDAVVSDIGLPGLDGWELARRLRASLGPGVRLVAVSAYGSPKDLERSRQSGFDTHLVKPVDVKELLALLPPPRPGAAPGVSA